MAKGRKIAVNTNSDWENVFYNSVGAYVQFINHELSKYYELEPLSNHIKIIGGYAFKTAEYQKQGIPIIRISDFNNEQIVLKDVVYYKEANELEKYELKESDIIIALTGGTIAKLAIVQAGLGKIYLNQRVGKFQVLHPELFEKEYIYWIARSVQNSIKNLAWGAAIPNVSPKQIESIEFPFPPKEIQQGIIRFLNDLKSDSLFETEYFNSDIEAKIIALQNNQFNGNEITKELSHQLNLVKQLRQAFLREAMQGKLVGSAPLEVGSETGHELLAKIKAEKAKLIAEKKLKKEKELPFITEDEIPFKIPEHWAWCRLGEICLKITDGFHNTPPKVSKGFPYIAATQVKSDKIDWENCNYVEEKFHRELYNKTTPIKGEILVVNIGAGCGTPAIIDVDFEFSFKNTAILKFNQYLLFNKYLFYYFILRKDEFYSNLTKGGLQPFLSLKILNEIDFPLPPLHEQEQIVANLEELMAICDGLEQSIKESQRYNEMLLQQVLREALQSTENVKI
jgi:restriction endonuclease S subunit